MKYADTQKGDSLKKTRSLYVLSYLLGMIIYVIWKNYFLTEYGLLCETRLRRMMVCDWNSIFYVCYLLERRVPIALILYIICKRQEYRIWLEVFINGLFCIAGLLFAECFIRYGIIGAILGMAISFPQGIFYICAVYYIRNIVNTKRGNRFEIVRFSIYLILFGVGILLEIFCNPYILKGIILKMK